MSRQTINVAHECIFCVPAHKAMAKHMKIDETVTNALMDETLLPIVKLEALREFTLEGARTREYTSKDSSADFLNVGHTHKGIVEFVLGSSQKVISN